jgi:hypothetical protein
MPAEFNHVSPSFREKWNIVQSRPAQRVGDVRLAGDQRNQAIESVADAVIWYAFVRSPNPDRVQISRPAGRPHPHARTAKPRPEPGEPRACHACHQSLTSYPEFRPTI